MRMCNSITAIQVEKTVVIEGLLAVLGIQVRVLRGKTRGLEAARLDLGSRHLLCRRWYTNVIVVT